MNGNFKSCPSNDPCNDPLGSVVDVSLSRKQPRSSPCYEEKSMPRCYGNCIFSTHHISSDYTNCHITLCQKMNDKKAHISSDHTNGCITLSKLLIAPSLEVRETFRDQNPNLYGARHIARRTNPTYLILSLHMRRPNSHLPNTIFANPPHPIPPT